MVSVANTKRQNENDPPKKSSSSDDLDISEEPFNPAANLKKRRTGTAVNVAKSAFEDTLSIFAESDGLADKCTYFLPIYSYFDLHLDNTLYLQLKIPKKHGRESQYRKSIQQQKNLVNRHDYSIAITKIYELIFDASLVFQQIEADEYIDYRINRPVIRFFGVTNVSG
jgi:hypothetical protein